ncbi:MAG: hypothetical protein V8T46_08865 [Sutterella seckii]
MELIARKHIASLNEAGFRCCWIHLSLKHPNSAIHGKKTKKSRKVKALANKGGRGKQAQAPA